MATAAAGSKLGTNGDEPNEKISINRGEEGNQDYISEMGGVKI